MQSTPHRSPSDDSTASGDLPTEVAVYAAVGLGDGLIAMTIAQELAGRGHRVSLWNSPLLPLQSLFPGVEIQPFPAPTDLHASLGRFSFVYAMDFTPVAERPADFPHAVVLWEKDLDRKQTMVRNYRRFCREHLGGVNPPEKLTWVTPSEWGHRVRDRRIAVHPVSTESFRDWTVSRFLGLAHRLRARGYEVAFVMAPHQRPRFAEVIRQGFAVPHFESLGDTARFLHESGYFIGVDSGLGHLASMLGIPTLSIVYCQDQADFWRPGWGGTVAVPYGPLPFISWRHWQRIWPCFLSVGRVEMKFAELVSNSAVTERAARGASS